LSSGLQKGKHDIYALRYDDPSEYAKEQQGDVQFWMNFHADWYALVILCKSHPTTEMKSINWEYLFEIDLPVVKEVQDACRRILVPPRSLRQRVVSFCRSFMIGVLF
jgi:hypothetical protein